MDELRKKEVIALGERIKKIIEKKGLKVMNVSHDANLDSTNFRKYIRGTQDMRYTTLLRIANALGITPSELLDGLTRKKD